MVRRSQLRLVFHGSIFMLVTMLVGGPELIRAFNQVFLEIVRQSVRQWHVILITTGIWMIALGATLPLLELTSRGISWIVWSLIITGYSFIYSLGVLIYAVSHHIPQLSQHPPASQWEMVHELGWLGWLNLGLICINGLTSLIPALLVAWGAYRALPHSPIDDIN